MYVFALKCQNRSVAGNEKSRVFIHGFQSVVKSELYRAIPSDATFIKCQLLNF